MNELQNDELMALDSILPDRVTWTRRESDDKVEVKIIIELDLGEERDVQVWDWTSPSPVVIDSKTEADGARPTMTSLAADAPSFTPSSSSSMQVDMKSRRRGGGKRSNSSSTGRSEPAPRPAPTLLRSPPAIATTSIAASPTSSPRSQGPVVMTLARRNKDSPALPPTIIRRPAAPEPVITTAKPSTPSPARSGIVRVKDKPENLKLRYLPPIEILAVLTNAYPLESAPESVRIIDRAGWLSEEWRKLLMDKINDVWSGDECLWAMVDLVQNDQIVDTLSLSFPLILRQAPPHRTPTSPPEPLSSSLSSHDLAQRTSTFSITTYTCSLCLSSLKGARCVRLSSCSDVFCAQCLKDYYSLLITEGLVRSVTCPGIECTTERVKWEREHKDDEEGRPGEVGPDELRTIVGDELVERYQWLTKKQKLESDPSVSYCPRCQSAVPKADEEKLRICSSCDYAYCVFCRRVWHGPRNPCALPQSSAIVTQYLAASPSTQASLELRFGKANIRRLVAVFEEERLNREWLEKMTMKCPGCDAGVEKSQGCNHMQCSRCSSHFCYRCGKSLSPIDPYTHFNTPGSSCYQKLFDFSPGSGQEPAVEEWLGEVVAEEGVEADQDVAIALQQEMWHEQGWNPFR